MVTTSTNQLVLTGTLELTDGVATWLPSVEAPPLSPGAYNIALRFENALGEQSWSGSYPLTVTKPLILISVDGDVRSFPKDQIGRKPNTVAKGGTLEAIGWVTNTLIFAKVRVPGSRTVWWVNVSQLSNVRATLEDGSPAEQSVKERLPQVPLPAEIAP